MSDIKNILARRNMPPVQKSLPESTLKQFTDTLDELRERFDTLYSRGRTACANMEQTPAEPLAAFLKRQNSQTKVCNAIINKHVQFNQWMYSAQSALAQSEIKAAQKLITRMQGIVSKSIREFALHRIPAIILPLAAGMAWLTRRATSNIPT